MTLTYRNTPWLLTFLLATASLVACSEDSTTVVPDGPRHDISQMDSTTQQDTGPDTKTDDATQQDVTTTDGSAVSDATNDAPAACIHLGFWWGADGGLVAHRDESALTNCKDFTLTRSFTAGGNPVSCSTSLSPSHPTVAAVLATFAEADVQAALTGDTPFFGKDDRPADGPAFKLVVGQAALLIGSACGGAADCVAIPAGLATLQTQLTALTEEQRSTEACAALKTL